MGGAWSGGWRSGSEGVRARLGRSSEIGRVELARTSGGAKRINRGSLEPSKLADMVVISGNLLTLPGADLLRTRVLYTIVGGDVVYARPGASTWHSGQLFGAMPEFNHAE